MLDTSASLKDLRIPPSNHLEALKENLRGWHSIRISRQWRKGYTENVMITDYHRTEPCLKT